MRRRLLGRALLGMKSGDSMEVGSAGGEGSKALVWPDLDGGIRFGRISQAARLNTGLGIARCRWLLRGCARPERLRSLLVADAAVVQALGWTVSDLMIWFLLCVYLFLYLCFVCLIPGIRVIFTVLVLCRRPLCPVWDLGCLCPI